MRFMQCVSNKEFLEMTEVCVVPTIVSIINEVGVEGRGREGSKGSWKLEIRGRCECVCGDGGGGGGGGGGGRVLDSHGPAVSAGGRRM